LFFQLFLYVFRHLANDPRLRAGTTNPVQNTIIRRTRTTVLARARLTEDFSKPQHD
jgi:hypothetical protein